MTPSLWGGGGEVRTKKNPAHSPERKEEGPASTWAADGGAGSRQAVGLVSVACGNEEGGQLPDN